MRKIIAFTGAGISVDSGLPTFETFDRSKLTRKFADEHPKEYNEMIAGFVDKIRKAQPNDAHYALADYKIPIITMNFDGLHQKAGSTDVLEIHGTLPQTKEEIENASLLVGKPILYGDLAPNYSNAFKKILDYDTLVICGASNYTGIAEELIHFACDNGLEIFGNIMAEDLRFKLEELIYGGK